MHSQQIVQHLERALIEVEYAAGDISDQLSSCADASCAAKGKAALAALVATKRLLRDLLTISSRQAPHVQASCAA